MTDKPKKKTVADYPELVAQWHPTKNGELGPGDFTAGSGKKVWWKCAEGPDHEWEVSSSRRSGRGDGCPFCSGRRVSVTNSLKSLRPDLAAEWHPLKNGELTPDTIVCGSNKKVWWKCENGPDHEWAAVLASRVAGNGCRACAGQQVSVTNSLEALFPEVAAQWHPTKNGDLTPEQIVGGSGKKVWWKCPKGTDHEWKGSIDNRTGLGRGCPACAGRQVSVTNSLATVMPAVAEEWHPTKNGKISPGDIAAGTHKKFWWKCAEHDDHEWFASVENRSNGTGCPACSGHQLSQTNILIVQFPEIATEWHPTKNGGLRPDKITAGNPKRVWWKCPEGPDHEWRASVGGRTGRGRGCPACSGKQVSVTNSLASVDGDLAAEWHPTKNGELTPKLVTSGTPKKVWWKCREGPDHEWQATIGSRSAGCDCPFCSGRRASREYNLASTHPNLAGEWHPTKNGVLTPRELTPSSGQYVWWQCQLNTDHAWKAPPSRRSDGSGCPECSGHWSVGIPKDERRRTDTLADFPSIVAQLHPAKNPTLVLAAISGGSNKTLWWKCPKGPDHEWRANVANRIKGGGCPACSGHQLSVTNSLLTVSPKIASEWHPTKNGGVVPADVVAGTNKAYWWKCPLGPDHEWRAGANSRLRGRGCPACSGHMVSVTNSLATVQPNLSREWHPTKNGDLTPKMVTAGTPKKVWWKCEKGSDHEWTATIASRAAGNGCRACAGYQVSETNNLLSLFPEIADQWHPTRNGTLMPREIVAGSGRRVWWKCPEGPDHEWQATLDGRTSRGSGCPACAGIQVSVTNSLAALFPDVAATWHPTKNGDLRPKDVSAGSHKISWWQCGTNSDHEWDAPPGNRTRRGDGCPYCSIVPRSKQEIRLAFELAYHISIDHEAHKVKTAKRLWDVDICAPELKLVIEFDGAYWHAEKGEKDRNKAKNLRRNGWRVIRVREAPLKKLSRWNVVIPHDADDNEAALMVLEHLQIVLDMDIPRMAERRAAEGPLCADAAEAYIEKLLIEKQAKEEQDG